MKVHTRRPRKARRAQVARARTCECGKAVFLSRKEAKRALSQFPGSDCRVYECTLTPGVFHWGHLPRQVVRGEIARAQIYPPRSAS